METSLEIPTVSFPWFLAKWFWWHLGEHVTLVGPTGQGKTTLAKKILPRRRFVVVFATKPRDPGLSALESQGYETIEEWPPPPGIEKVLLWPRIAKPSDVEHQKAVFRKALEEIFGTGNWTIYLDELPYIVNTLGLESYVKLIWLQGRSLGISQVSSTQRPRGVPLEAYGQSTHLFFWRATDAEDLKRIGGLGALNSVAIREAVSSLERYQVLYVNTRDDLMVKTKVSM